jgi:cytochrome c5
LSNDLGNDLASLLKDLTSGNTSAAKADVSKVQANLQTQDTSSVAAAQSGSTLDALIGKISDSLNAGSVQGAPQEGPQHDLANFLVENGQGTGSLINTSA